MGKYHLDSQTLKFFEVLELGKEHESIFGGTETGEHSTSFSEWVFRATLIGLAFATYCKVSNGQQRFVDGYNEATTKWLSPGFTSEEKARFINEHSQVGYQKCLDDLASDNEFPWKTAYAERFESNGYKKCMKDWLSPEKEFDEKTAFAKLHHDTGHEECMKKWTSENEFPEKKAFVNLHRHAGYQECMDKWSSNEGFPEKDQIVLTSYKIGHDSGKKKALNEFNEMFVRQKHELGKQYYEEGYFQGHSKGYLKGYATAKQEQTTRSTLNQHEDAEESALTRVSLDSIIDFYQKGLKEKEPSS